MQALSMIEMGAVAPEAGAASKPAQSQGKQFGKVLNEQQQPEPQPTTKAKQGPAENGEDKQVRRQSDQPEQSIQKTTATAQAQPESQVVEAAAGVSAEAVAAESKLQQVLIDLLQAIAGGENSSAQAEVADAEQVGSIDELLNQLVEQLEGAELKGEQVLAGIDLSALVEQLQDLKAQGGEEQLEQLVEQLGIQLEEQLVTEKALTQMAQQAATLQATSDPQTVAPKLVENLAQARQILQQAIDAVATGKAPQVVFEEAATVKSEGAVVEIELRGAEKSAEQLDPRFAGLLKPRGEGRQYQQPSLHNQENSARLNPEQVKLNPEQVMTENQPERAEVADFVRQLGAAPKQQGIESLLQQAQGPQQAAGTQAGQPVVGKLMPETPMVQLPSGQQVTESQIFDQVVARFSGSFNGEAKRMVLRMHPAELGSLKIELMVEGDRIRANLHAQSMQVQEVLERNLPQLRSALAEQGLKIDQFQVDVNQDQSQQEQFEQLAQQQQKQQGTKTEPGWQQSQEVDEQLIPLAHLMQNGGGGISLHV